MSASGPEPTGGSDVGGRDPETGELITTAAAYSGRGAPVLDSPYDFKETMLLRCPQCGWNGPASAASREFYNELFDLSCPRCDTMLLIVPYPTHEETKAAAAAGSELAQRDLPSVQQHESRSARAKGLALKVDSPLPELDGDRLQFVWDIDNADHRERPDDEIWTVISCGDTLVWRELAYWEGWERFNEVKDILKSRYGEHFARLKPTQSSEMYLYGDAWSTANLEED